MEVGQKASPVSASGNGSSAAGQVDVSVLGPVRNEARFIRESFETMARQEFDGTIEFLLIDGESDDETRAILDELAAEDERVRVFDNPGRIQAAGLNLGLREARGEFIVQMDGHTYYPRQFVARGVDRLRRGDVEYVSARQVPVGVDAGSRRVALALGSWLGTGGSTRWGSQEWSRDSDAEEPVDDEIDVDTGVFGGVWRRSTLEALGGWHEGGKVNRDAELAARILAAGGRIVCIPDFAAEYVPRSTLRALARQYARYGFYRVSTATRNPGSLRRSHVLLPGLTVAVVLAPTRGRIGRLARAGLAVYGIAVAGTSARLSGARPGDALGLPPVFVTMHLAWGVGFFAGWLRYGPPLRALWNAIVSR